MSGDSVLDQAGELRDEDALDVAAVGAWLRQAVPGLMGEPSVRQFAGGASNLTYLLTFGEGEQAEELVLRTSPAGTKAKGAHDMGREVRVQRALAAHGAVAVPEIVAHDAEGAVLGREAYAMRRVRGVVLRRKPPGSYLADPADAARVCEGAVQQLAHLHGLDPAAVGLDDLGPGKGYVGRQIEGWAARHGRALTPGAAEFTDVIAWLRDQQPDDVATVVVHNDFRLDNLVLDAHDPGRILAVLDWEMATLGCPLMDVGNSLAYWVQADDPDLLLAVRRQPTHVAGMFTRAQVWQRYAELTGYVPHNPAFYEVYGLFRLAVIVQQIFLRFHKGQTTNPRFANFGVFAGYLEQVCLARMAGS